MVSGGFEGRVYCLKLDWGELAEAALPPQPPTLPVDPVIPLFFSTGIAVAVLIVNYPGSWAAGVIIAFAFFTGGALSSGIVWKHHPLVANLSYWDRVRFAFRNSRVLREQSFADQEPLESEAVSR
ncbi:hypothetical protein [Marisediminicola antarctica]|uniref:Uncharacterized protein n=1 Tax=Marisediminicola antarctica TaxID=674079 RepID=A0A7L5AER4_9MICO|nr:hypothetical protein [Marisediminicola antarctica]QHO68908.1 hypothetical protein BHD05_03900 [Marisediminicola antarctica]